MILIVFSHPYTRHSHANKAIINGIANIDNVVIDDLYEKYPDFHINVDEEQTLLSKAKLIIFQFPIYWYNVPALLKLWQEVVLTRQFILSEKSKGNPHKGRILQGKSTMIMTTTGHKDSSYQKNAFDNYNLEDFLRPIEQVSIHCGMNYHSPLALHQAHRASAVELSEFTQRYSERIQQLYQQIKNNDE